MDNITSNSSLVSPVPEKQPLSPILAESPGSSTESLDKSGLDNDCFQQHSGVGTGVATGARPTPRVLQETIQKLPVIVSRPQLKSVRRGPSATHLPTLPHRDVECEPTPTTDPLLCIYNGCYRQKYESHNFCGKTHANMYHSRDPVQSKL